MNEVLNNIISRRSCKSYRKDPLPKEIIDQIIEAGLYAPSALNRQTPLILAVTDPETRNTLSRLNAKYDPFKRPDPFYNAPCVLCVLVPKDEPAGRYDGPLVLENMMLAAYSLGIGSCWIHRAKEVFEDPEGKMILLKAGITGDYEGIGNCVIGYADLQPEGPLERKKNRVFRL